MVRRFLHAFLALEVRHTDLAARAEIRRDSAPSFARELLSISAHPGPKPGTAPRITALRIAGTPGRPDFVLVTGSAGRPSGPELFAFLFSRRHDRWLAAAPAE